MELVNVFQVPAGMDRAWEVLTDVQRIAPCLPGAELLESSGDTFRGVVKVKVGPIRMRYSGTARFESVDADTRAMVVVAEGRDAQGQGTAGATIRVELADDGDQTAVTVRTDLQITGKIAQFGRSSLADVSGRLLAQFAENLKVQMLAEAVPPIAPRQASSPTLGSKSPPSAADSGYIDLMASARPVIVRRAAPLAILLLSLAAAWLLGRRGA